MKSYGTRGAIDPLTLAIIIAAGATLCVPSLKNRFFTKKPPVNQLEQTQKELADAKSRSEALAKQLDEIQDKERKAQMQQVEYAQQMVAGAKASNDRAAPSPATQLTGELINRADFSLGLALGKLPAEKQDEIIKIVNQRLSGFQAQIDAANATLASKDAELQAVTRERNDFKAIIPELKVQVANADTKAAKLEAKATALSYKVNEWANKKLAEEAKSSSIQSQLEKYTLILMAVIGIWLLGPILTFLSKFAPSLAAPAKAINATMSYVLHRQTAEDQKTIEEYQTAVGKAIGQIRAELPDVADKVRNIFDTYTTPKQQEQIKTVAEATHGAILSSDQSSKPTINNPQA